MFFVGLDIFAVKEDVAQCLSIPTFRWSEAVTGGAL